MLTRVQTGWARVKQLHRDWEGAYPRWLRLSLAIGLCVLVGWLFSGCQSMGTKVGEERLVEIEKGRTTYQQVVHLYGKPNTVLLREDGSRQIAYTYEQGQNRVYNYIPVVGGFLRGGDTESTHTVLEFDSAGLLVSYHSYAGQMGTGRGIISGARSR